MQIFSHHCRSLNSTEKILESHCSAGIDLLVPVRIVITVHANVLSVLK